MRMGNTGINRPVRLDATSLARHLLILGTTGAGKSSLLVNIALQHAKRGDGLALSTRTETDPLVALFFTVPL